MPHQINKRLHFSVPIFYCELEGFEEHRQGLRDLILEMKNNSEGLKVSNVNGWHSDNNFHTLDNPHVEWLRNQLGDIVVGCVNNAGQAPESYEVVLNSCWANVNGPNGWNTPHNHFPNHWSGVLYVDVEDCIDYDDPAKRDGKIEFFNPIHLSTAFGLPGGVTYAPKNGVILMFHSPVQHMAHAHFVDHERVSVAFNVNVVPKAPQGKPESE